MLQTDPLGDADTPCLMPPHNSNDTLQTNKVTNNLPASTDTPQSTSPSVNFCVDGTPIRSYDTPWPEDTNEYNNCIYIGPSHMDDYPIIQCKIVYLVIYKGTKGNVCTCSNATWRLRVIKYLKQYPLFLVVVLSNLMVQLCFHITFHH